MRNCLSDNFRWRAWHELDDTRRDASFGKNLVYNIIRIRCCRRGFPEDNITDESGCYQWQ